MRTLPLDENWDLELTGGNLEATADEARFTTQTASNACRHFTGDSVLFPLEGIPYKPNILGSNPPQALVKEYLKREILSVPLITAVQINNYLLDGRKISAEAFISTENGGRENVSF